MGVTKVWSKRGGGADPLRLFLDGVTPLPAEVATFLVHGYSQVDYGSSPRTNISRKGSEAGYVRPWSQ